MSRLDIIFVTSLICIIAIIIYLAAIIHVDQYEEEIKFVCDTMDPDNVLTDDECRHIIEETKEGPWGSAVNNAVISKTTDEFLLQKCIELASITKVSKLECYTYMENNPGSTGNQVLDGILEQRENFLNRPLN